MGYIGIASALLRHVRLSHFIDRSGRPTGACWKCLDEGTLASSERVMLALALAILDYSMPDPPVRVGELMQLDDANLRAAGEALIALADHR